MTPLRMSGAMAAEPWKVIFPARPGKRLRPRPQIRFTDGEHASVPQPARPRPRRCDPRPPRRTDGRDTPLRRTHSAIPKRFGLSRVPREPQRRPHGKPSRRPRATCRVSGRHGHCPDVTVRRRTNPSRYPRADRIAVGASQCGPACPSPREIPSPDPQAASPSYPCSGPNAPAQRASHRQSPFVSKSSRSATPRAGGSPPPTAVPAGPACKVGPEPARCRRVRKPAACSEMAEPSERQVTIPTLRQPHVRKPVTTRLSFRASRRTLLSTVRRCGPGAGQRPCLISCLPSSIPRFPGRSQRYPGSRLPMPGRSGFQCPRAGYRIGRPGTGTDIMPHMAPWARGTSRRRICFAAATAHTRPAPHRLRRVGRDRTGRNRWGFIGRTAGTSRPWDVTWERETIRAGPKRASAPKGFRTSARPT